MGRLRDFFNHTKNAMSFSGLPLSEKQITFYSEGRNYWSYIGGLLEEILETTQLNVCYISSSADDPGLQIEHPRLRKFLIDEGAIRDWVFANMETPVLVMTMPDLGQYQVKCSKYEVHYVYVQHSLVSLHMVYRPGAFDYFDTVFCAGPHHIKELRALEASYNLPEKSIYEHGYARLDSILSEAALRRAENGSNIQESSKEENRERKHYLLAPSWGPNGTLEIGVGETIVALLLEADQKVTLRPHPQTLKFSPKKIEAILSAWKDHPNFNFEANVDGQASLHASDVMISDWSGAALDYAFGLGKPVIFIDVPRKVNNPDYEAISIEPFEVSIRDDIGMIISPDALEQILNFEINPLPHNLAKDYFYNVGISNQIGVQELVRLASLHSGDEASVS